MNKIDSLLAERGLTSEYKEQAVRQLLCHMMTTGCRKERKKRGEKKKSPRTPLIKEKQPEKIEKETSVCVGDAKEEFRQECLRYIGQYDKQLVIDFYYYWSVTSKRGTMREE